MTYTITHKLSEDGLTLTTRLDTEDGGNATLRVSWNELEVAQANYEVAITSGEKRLREKYVQQLADMPPNETSVSRVRVLLKTRWGKLELFSNSGPPTWWCPRLSLHHTKRSYGIRGGWIRRAYQLDWVLPK